VRVSYDQYVLFSEYNKLLEEIGIKSIRDLSLIGLECIKKFATFFGITNRARMTKQQLYQSIISKLREYYPRLSPQLYWYIYIIINMTIHFIII